MAEWSPTVAYAPGAVVSYNGSNYWRSSFPPTPTMGTKPNEEMSVDSKGDAIRTWTIDMPNMYSYRPTYHTCYFRLIDPTYNSTDFYSEFLYAGEKNYQENAYGPMYDVNENSERIGYSVEYDQPGPGTPPYADSPACPADKCGVAFQQYQGVPYSSFPAAPYEISEGAKLAVQFGQPPDAPYGSRVYYFWAIFNHPLYFRRTINLLYRFQKTTVAVPEDIITYESGWVSFTPTDKNYSVGPYEFTIANSVGSFTLPDDDPGVTYYSVTEGTGSIDVQGNW